MFSLWGFFLGAPVSSHRTKTLGCLECVWMVCMPCERLVICPGYSFFLTQQHLTENGWLCSTLMMHCYHTRRKSIPGQGRSMSECMFSSYLCGFYPCKLLHLKDIQVLLGLDEFLKFLKKDSWMLLCVLIFHFNVLLAILLYCFQITYKSSTDQRWWSTYGQCPIRQSPSHGSRSNWPMGTHFRPSCWSVGFSHTHKHPHNNCSFSIIVHFFQMFYVFFLQFL